jgi:hypothetical protein
MEEKTTKIEIEEDELPPKEKPEGTIREELRQLGEQFGETVRGAWHSEERVRAEAEIKEGFQAFVNEVDKAFRKARQGEAAAKLKEEARQVREDVRAGEFRHKARANMMQGLKWLSVELDRLADRFTPAEKSPEDLED